MNLQTLLKSLDSETARAFVGAAKNVIDALLVEGQRVDQTRTPAPRDYGAAKLSRTAPAGGWISQDELRQTTQRLSEAIAREKWIDGAAFVIQWFARMGG